MNKKNQSKLVKIIGFLRNLVLLLMVACLVGAMSITVANDYGDVVVDYVGQIADVGDLETVANASASEPTVASIDANALNSKGILDNAQELNNNQDDSKQNNIGDDENSILKTEKKKADEVNLSVDDKIVPFDYDKSRLEEIINDPELTLSDSAFIGNSIVVGLEKWGNIPKAQFYAVEGLNVITYYRNGMLRQRGGITSVANAVKSANFKQAFIMFGINEITWKGRKVFIDDYKKIIEEIKADHPDVRIYVMSCLNVSKKKNDSSSSINNKNINQLNSLLIKLCKDTNVSYLDINPGIIDDKGFLPSDATGDGIHLNPAYCKRWKAYMESILANQAKYQLKNSKERQ